MPQSYESTKFHKNIVENLNEMENITSCFFFVISRFRGKIYDN